MILLQQNNFCTSPTEHFEKVKGKKEEMSHHLHKLIYLLVWSLQLGEGLREIVFFSSLLNDIYCLQKQ